MDHWATCKGASEVRHDRVGSTRIAATMASPICQRLSRLLRSLRAASRQWRGSVSASGLLRAREQGLYTFSWSDREGWKNSKWGSRLGSREEKSSPRGVAYL